jgi:hypothetical protein
MSRVLEYGSEYLTIDIIWESPDTGVDSRIDFYHYQVLDSLSEENASVILDLNTTNTTVIIDVNGINTSNDFAAMLQFVLSAWNCNGASIPVAIVISIDNGTGEKEILLQCQLSIIYYCAYTDHFGAETTYYTLSSKPSLVTDLEMSENNVNILLTSIYSLCGAGVFVLLITCLVLSLVCLKLLRKKDREFSLPQAQRLDDDIIPEVQTDNLKADLSLNSYDKSDIYSEPVFENIKCGASVEDYTYIKEDIPNESCLR